MKSRDWVALAALSLPMLAFSANEAAPGDQRILLKDGTLLVIEPGGLMQHYDSDRQPLKMAPGTRMEAKDGVVYEMRSNALWQRLWLRGTMRDVR